MFCQHQTKKTHTKVQTDETRCKKRHSDIIITKLIISKWQKRKKKKEQTKNMFSYDAVAKKGKQLAPKRS